MAHQAHNIPWKSLADNFNYRYEFKRLKSPGYMTNLFPIERKNFDKNLQYFCKAFSRTLEEHTQAERPKHAELIPPLDDDEEIFSRATARKIEGILSQGTGKVLNDAYKRLLNERSIISWFNHMENWGSKVPTYEQIEIMKCLIMLGEIQPVLQVLSRDTVRIYSIWTAYPCDKDDYGLKRLFNLALSSYITLNVLLQKPELYDDVAKRGHIKDPIPGWTVVPDESYIDYRHTFAYQRTVLECTDTRTQALPHRAFLGFSHKQKERNPKYLLQMAKLCGTMRLPEFEAALGIDSKYAPDKNDTSEVMQILQRKNLPTELCLTVMEFADYSPARRSLISADPLNHQNAQELRKYLTYCWQLLIRANIVTESFSRIMDWENSKIDWEIQVEKCVRRLFIDPVYRKGWNEYPDDRSGWDVDPDTTGCCTACHGR